VVLIPNSSSLYVGIRSNILEMFVLTFELSAIDVILSIAVIILLILYIKKLSTKPTTEQKPSIDKIVPPEKPEAKITSVKAEEVTVLPTQSSKNSKTCPYHFGYLKKHAKNKPIPDECWNCSRIVECLYPIE